LKDSIFEVLNVERQHIFEVLNFERQHFWNFCNVGLVGILVLLQSTDIVT
jgi:hypothetical protein